MEIMQLPCGAELIINRLNRHGYRADIVGGAVRDLYLGRIAPDFDITTNARPEAVKEVFSDLKTIDTGIKHGTVTVIAENKPYEVTTYRLDGEYKDARHPESVTFTDELACDLSRRDFTMNAMAYNHNDGITDLFFGRRDIDSKIIRTVGDANLRFSEDALRILRALRFAAMLDFEIESGTRVAIFDKKELLCKVSRERIYIEWKKLIAGIGAYRILEEYKAVFEDIFGIGISLPNERLFVKADGLTRMLSLFVPLGKGAPESFEKVMLDLHTDNKTRHFGRAALCVINEFPLESIENVLYAFNAYGKKETECALRIGLICEKYSGRNKKMVDMAALSGLPYKLGDLKVNGKELLAFGLRGEQIGEMLNLLLSLVIEGKLENEKSALLSEVAKRG